MEKVPAPDELFRIPENVDPAQRIYVAAQIAIQAVILASGSRFADEPVTAMNLAEVRESLLVALAMVHSTAAGGLTTPRDIRLRGEAIGKEIADMIKDLKSGGDTTADQIFEAMGITFESTN